MLYFAYGSNMYTPRLRYRVKSASPLGIAQLHGYELKWHKRSKKDGSGKCNAAKSKAAAVVFGVVFDLDSKEKRKLGAAEGVGYGYHCADMEVIRNGEKTRVFTYLADIDYIDDCLPVYAWYKEFVALGAEEHGLPDKYRDEIEAQQRLRIRTL